MTRVARGPWGLLVAQQGEPLLGLGHEMAVAKLDPFGGGSGLVPAGAAFENLPASFVLAGPALPLRLVEEGLGLVAIVVDRDLHGGLMPQRLACQGEVVAARSLDVDVAVVDANSFAGQPDQPLDVADFRIFGITEDDDVPTLGWMTAGKEGQVVGKHHHEDSVALERSGGR